jgi:phospholipase/carboxylesterase
MSRRPLAFEGEVPFVREVPYRLVVGGPGDGPTPLLVALHGKGDRADRFEEEAREALPPGWALLLPSGPVPRDRHPAKGGASLGDSWYLYDGDTPAFRESLDAAESHLLRVLKHIRRHGVFRPAALLGFSKGAYLAGVVGVRNPDRFRAVVQVAGRLKTEMLGPHLPAARGVRFLGLHGTNDAAVKPGPSAESLAAARAAGLDAEFREFDAGHEFTPDMRRAAREWLAAL